MRTLMEMDCIPAGMELFPSADEEQSAFIRRVIDDCDYYLLLVAGRYGSVTREGISYTEQEFDYAVSRGIRVVAFLHEDPDEIPVGKSDIDPELRDKLAAFRTKVASDRLVRFWKTSSDLPGLVALSLTKTIKTYPATGWVRASAQPATEVLSDLNDLRKENERLVAALATANAEARPSPIANIAPLDGPYTVYGAVDSPLGKRMWKVDTTWSEVFSHISAFLLTQPNEQGVELRLKREYFPRGGIGGLNSTLNDNCFETLKVQFLALGLVEVSYLKTTKGGMAHFWTLTAKGQRLMLDLRVIRQV